jgi:hypothetical protein
VSEEKKHKYNDVQIMEVTGFAIDQPMLHMWVRLQWVMTGGG